MILCLNSKDLHKLGAPRIRGDDPHPGYTPASDDECSPHPRG